MLKVPETLNIPEIQTQTRAVLDALEPWTLQEKMLLLKTVSSIAHFLLMVHSNASDDERQESVNVLMQSGSLLEEHTADIAMKIIAAIGGEKSADSKG